MIKKPFYLLLALSATSCLIFSSCNPSLGVVNYQTSVAPLQYEGHNDTVSVKRDAVYTSGFSTKSIRRSDGHDVNMGGISVYKSHNLKAYTYSYGAFGYAGNFRVGRINSNNINSDEKFWGAGLTAGSNLRLGKRVKFLDLGLRLTLLYEGGAFAKFREEYAQTDEFFDDRHPNRFTMHSAAQLTYKFHLGQVNFGIYNSFGMVSLGGDGLTPLLNMGIFASYKRFTLNTDTAAGHFESVALTTLGLTYKLW